MKQCKDCKKQLPLTEFFVSKKSGIYSNCKSCLKILRKINRIEKKDQIAAKVKEYAIAHVKEIKQYQRQYYLENYEKLRAIGNEYGRQHRDIMNKAQEKWRKANPDKKLAQVRKRQAAKINRTPKWLTKADYIEMEWAYSIARQLTRETGIKHVVDHIIPLRGKTISGFHCPQNLQIITKIENEKKGNLFPYKVK